MKVKELLKLRTSEFGSDLKTYDLFGITKRRSKELKALFDKEYIRQYKPTSDLFKTLPKQATEKTRADFKKLLDEVISWTARRRYIEVIAEVDVRNINEANYLIFVVNIESFNRISTNQNMAVDINNMLELLNENPNDSKPGKNKR